MTLFCKHGRPVTWGIEGPTETETLSYKYELKVTMCKQCVDEGIAQHFAYWLSSQIRKYGQR